MSKKKSKWLKQENARIHKNTMDFIKVEAQKRREKKERLE